VVLTADRSAYDRSRTSTELVGAEIEDQVLDQSLVPRYKGVKRSKTALVTPSNNLSEMRDRPFHSLDRAEQGSQAASMDRFKIDVLLF
jgi:hypothetical protein